jgi:hypothetical protein
MDRFVKLMKSENQPLADFRPTVQNALITYKYCYAWTIALSDKMRFHRKNIRPTVPNKYKYLKWGSMTTDQQRNALNDLVVMVSECSLFPEKQFELFGFFELTKNGNIHLHMSIHTNEQPNLQVLLLRRLCSQIQCMIMLHRCKNESKLNYIHTIEDVPEWVKYITKDYKPGDNILHLYRNIRK